MTAQEAKEILVRYRLHTADETDPEFAEALQFALADPELSQWLHDQQSFHDAMRDQLCAIEPPADLKARILAEKPQPKKAWPPFWGWYEIATVAACLAILLAGIIFLFNFEGHGLIFEKFRARMVSFALRTYQMDILTNDATAVRQYLASNGGPADFSVPPSLAKLPVKGGGRLTWQNRPVSMICFNLPDNQTLFMFVIDQQHVAGALPKSQPVANQEKKLATVEWTENGKAYLIAAATDPKTLASFAPSSQ
jgi:hypothetical protein